VPTDGFYEWARIAGGKQPYRIMMKGGDPFARTIPAAAEDAPCAQRLSASLILSPACRVPA
jgi:hypothetical protein